MLRSMFGMGGSEILVILIVALLFLGPDKLPEAAKTISKGIRDIKKQSKNLQQTIENDERIGGAIRDLKSALRGEDEPYRPAKPVPKKLPPKIEEGDEVIGPAPAAEAAAEPAPPPAEATHVVEEPVAIEPPKPAIALAPTVGEADGEVKHEDDDAELAAMIKPATGTVAKGS
jgi:sec-independent protein translocase protein TatB